VSEIHQEPSYAEVIFHTWLDRIDDNPWLSRGQIKAAYVLNERMTNIMEERGYTFDGLSFTPGTPYSRLCIRATEWGRPVVTFISERSFFLCLSIFLRKLSRNEVSWKVDKFR
jgi:hypothetical protein